MADSVPVTFSYRSSSASSVEVAGDWDNWSNRVQLSKVPGQQQDGQDLWQATKQLKPETKFQYKYIQNGDDWHTRDDLPTETDGSGNKNNVLESPAADHATSVDETKEKPAAEVIGAGVTSAVGAAIAGVVGVNPLESEKQPIVTTPGLTAGNEKQLNAAEKESALLNSAQGAPAGAAASGANGTVPAEQLSKLGLSDDKSPADAGAAAVTAAAASATGAVPAGSSTGSSAIAPNSLETIQKSEGAATDSKPAASSTAPQQGTLDQTDAAKGLAAGAAGDAPSLGSTIDGKATNAGPLDGVVAGAAGVGAALAGGATAAAAALASKSKEVSSTAQDKIAQSTNANGNTTISGEPASAAAPTATKDSNAQSAAEKPTISGAPAGAESGPKATAAKAAAPVAAAATTAAAAAGSVGAAAANKVGGQDAKATPAVAGNPTSEADAGIKAGAASTTSQSAPKQMTETQAKQEQLSSGPAAGSTTNADAAPQQPVKGGSTGSSAGAIAAGTAAVAAGGTAAGVAATGGNAQQSETTAKQEKISHGPAAAPSQSQAAPALKKADANTTAANNTSSDKSSAAAVATAATVAAAGGTAAGATAPGTQAQPSETAGKQEKVSSGPAAATSQSSAAPAVSKADANAAAVANSSAPVVAPVAAPSAGRRGDVTPPRGLHGPSTEYNGESPVSTAPPTPAKTPNKSETIGAKRGSRFGTRRKSKDLLSAGDENPGDVSESGEVFKTAPSSAQNTPEGKTLERSRKKSFFGRLKEKLGSK